MAGVSGVLLLLGLGVVVVGAVALIRGRARWAHVGTRGMGLMVAVAGLGLFLLGGALTPKTTPAASRASLGGTTTQATSPQTTTSAEASPTPLVAAPTTTTSLPVVTTPVPAVVITTQPPPPPKATYAPVPKVQAPVLPAPRPPVVVAPPPPAPAGSLGTAPIQKPPSGNFYRAGQFCPQVDAGKTTQDSSGRTLICTNNNGLRWEYA